MQVNRQGTDQITSENVYVDTNEMNRLYEEVNKQTNHGVNYNEGGGASAKVGGPIYDVPDDVMCKAEKEKLNNQEGATCGPLQLNGAIKCDNLKLAPKKCNLDREKKLVDPEKPSNLQQSSALYENVGSMGDDVQPLIVNEYKEPVSSREESEEPPEVATSVKVTEDELATRVKVTEEDEEATASKVTEEEDHTYDVVE